MQPVEVTAEQMWDPSMTVNLDSFKDIAIVWHGRRIKFDMERLRELGVILYESEKE